MINKLGIRMFRAIKKEFINIFNLDRLVGFEKIGIHIKARNLNRLNAQTGTTSSGTDFGLHLYNLYLFHDQ
jgi:hypothetical protein